MPAQDNTANEASATLPGQGVIPIDTDTPTAPASTPEPPTTKETQLPTEEPELKSELQDDSSQTLATPPGGSKKKFDKKGAITTIIGIILLIGGIIAGVLLVQQQQEIRERAASGSACDQHPDCILLDEPGNQGSYTADRSITHLFITAKDYHRFDAPGGDDGCYRVTITDNFIRWNRYGSGPNCKDVSNVQIWLGEILPSPTSTPALTPTPTLPPEVTPTVTHPTTPTPTPTLPPHISAQCLEIKAFDSEWNQLSSGDLTALNPGVVIRFTVAGSTSSGNLDRARFTINGTLRPEVTAKRPGTDEFFDEFTIPEGVASFTVNAQLHHSSLGWF